MLNKIFVFFYPGRNWWCCFLKWQFFRELAGFFSVSEPWWGWWRKVHLISIFHASRKTYFSKGTDLNILLTRFPLIFLRHFQLFSGSNLDFSDHTFLDLRGDKHCSAYALLVDIFMHCQKLKFFNTCHNFIAETRTSLQKMTFFPFNRWIGVNFFSFLTRNVSRGHVECSFSNLFDCFLLTVTMTFA